MGKKELSLEAVNQRLQSASIPVKVRQHGRTLALRAKLPPRPGSKMKEPDHQEISLGIYANPAGFQRAEAEAQHLGVLLALDKFEWSLYLKQAVNQGTALTCAGWIERFQSHFYATRGETPDTIKTWRKDYMRVLSHLPGDVELTEGVLILAAQRTKANTRSRLFSCQVLRQLANFAGLEIDLKPYRGNYSPKKVQTRNIPDDLTIAQVRDTILNNQWQWVYGVMAAYGLRDHEAFFVSIELDPPYNAHITEGKTGPRVVRPLYPEWVERWQLWDSQKPDCNGTHRDLGERTARAFKRLSVPFSPYNLRHAYAIRASVVFKFPVAVAAALLGHSPQQHWNHYNRWISQAQHEQIYREAIERENRPLAP